MKAKLIFRFNFKNHTLLENNLAKTIVEVVERVHDDGSEHCLAISKRVLCSDDLNDKGFTKLKTYKDQHLWEQVVYFRVATFFNIANVLKLFYEDELKGVSGKLTITPDLAKKLKKR